MHVRYRDPIIAGGSRRVYQKNKAKKRRRWIVLLIILLVVGFLYLLTTSEIPSGEAELYANNNMPNSGLNIQWPNDIAAAVGTIESGVLASSSENEKPRPIASMAKVITALAVLEKAPLNPGDQGITVVFDAADEANYHEYLAKLGTVTAVTAGQSMSQYQALQAMLLPSSNNMSDSLVRRVFGSVEEYVIYANQMLERHGLKHTRVDDASGFSPLTVSTPSEMIIIGQKALQNPVIAEIVAQPEAEIPLAGVVPNYNRLVKFNKANGIKPGNTDEAGWCLLFSENHTTESGQEVTIIGVVMGQENPDELFETSERLLASAKSDIQHTEVVRGGEIIGKYKTAWGAESDLVAKDSLWSYSWRGNLPKINTETTDQNLPLSSNQPVGLVYLGDDPDKAVQMVVSNKISQPSLLWRLKNSLSLAQLFQ